MPIHNSRFRSNWELSAARSIALVELFTKFGIARDRLSIAGYADTDPVDNNDTEEGRRKNRPRRHGDPERKWRQRRTRSAGRHPANAEPGLSFWLRN